MGQTAGRVRNLLGVARIYYKPSLGKFVIRKPGVVRRSERVIAINKKFASIKPASACKGKHFSDGSFQACLREQLRGL